MLRKLFAALSALLLAAGVTTAVAASASAHTGDLDATAKCESDGTYTITYTLTITNTQLNGSTKWRVGNATFEGTPTSNAGLDRGPVTSSGAGTITLGTTSVPGTSTKAPWAYAYTTWSDHYAKGSDGGDITLAGTCTVPTTKVTPTDPVVVDQCGSDNDSITLPQDTDKITYTRSGDYVYATLAGSNLEWGSSHPGWTSSTGGKLKYKLPTLSSEPCSRVETVCWVMTAYGKNAATPTAGAKSTFPQDLIDCDLPVPCGMWEQVDTYTIDSIQDEELWQSLIDKGTLTWVNGHPEDQSIYTSHVFKQGAKCKPDQPPALTGKDDRHTQECTQPLDGTATITYYSRSWTKNYVWDEDSWSWVLDDTKIYDGPETVTNTETVNDVNCAPPVIDVCTNLVGNQSEVPDGWSVKGTTCYHNEVVCWQMDNYSGDGTQQPPAGAESTFPQTRIDCDSTVPCGLWVQKDWYHIDSDVKEAVWTSLGDTLEWQNGHPEDSLIYAKHSFTYSGDCPPPPPFCTITDGDAVSTYYEGDTLPDHYTWKGEGECSYTPPECTYNDQGYWDLNDLPDGVVYDEQTQTCRDAVTPTLEATLVPMCIQNVPFLDYTATMNDPDNQASQNQIVTFTFLNKSGNGDPNWAKDFTLTESSPGVFTSSGTFAWPFATYTGTLPGTIVGTGWPGWEQDGDGAWQETADGHNGGWTRDGVDVAVDVNPHTDILGVEYPAAAFPCTPELHNELDAPPAEPVDGVASYAG